VVFISVIDRGCGIPPNRIGRIFDPFFTSKPVGQGTGLGLAISYSIVKRHHGRIEVKSTEGKGSEFTVWLPVEQPPSSISDQRGGLFRTEASWVLGNEGLWNSL
jgi:signal transduction histidine kinase